MSRTLSESRKWSLQQMAKESAMKERKDTSLRGKRRVEGGEMGVKC